MKLCNKVNFLENEINKISLSYQEKINNLEMIISNQAKEIDILNQWKKKYDIEIQNLIEKKKDDISLKNIDSKIIKNKKEIDFLEKRLKNDDPMLMNRTIIYKLLYRATRDGNSASSFHQKCDNICGTLVVIKTTKGFRFGGYTEQEWNIYYEKEKKKR